MFFFFLIIFSQLSAAESVVTLFNEHKSGPNDILMSSYERYKAYSNLKRLQYPDSSESIRLRSSNFYLNSGLVQVNKYGKWGYVCKNNWDLRDATVACKQLGFSLGAITVTNINESVPQNQWPNAQIMMDEVQCHGTEKSIHFCHHDIVHNCMLHDVAAVMCYPNQGCPEEWVSGFGKCYKFYSKAKSIKLAASVCARDNASLVTTESIEENHFLSNVIKNSVPHIHQFYTGGVKKHGKWLWNKFVYNTDTKKKGNKNGMPAYKTVKSAVRFSRWFPGWPSHNNQNAEPVNKEKYDCLTLSDEFNNPFKGTTIIDYFYWKADTCEHKEGINFICQLDANNDEDIGHLSVATVNCQADQFYCTRKRICIPIDFRCDNEADCIFGEDEVNCVYELHNFSKTSGAVLYVDDSSEADGSQSYPGLSDEMCAKKCLASTDFHCLSFVYQVTTRMCNISKFSSLQHGRIIPSTLHDYYELKIPDIFTEECEGQFLCDDKQCADIHSQCNKVYNCRDHSDEKDCGKDHFTVSLAGKDDFSGTVEIVYNGTKGLICDDHWSLKNAIVTCKMLGFSGAVRSTGMNFFNYPVSNLPFLMDDVRCLGNETSLDDCKRNPWKMHNCVKYEVAGVVCQGSRACDDDHFKCRNNFCLNPIQLCNDADDCGDNSDEQDCESISYQLVNGSGPWEGRVEVKRNGLVGSVCDDHWNDKDANVLCRYLGFKNGGIAMSEGYYGPGQGPIWFDNVRCFGNETSLELCSHAGWAKHDCEHTEDAGVKCFTATSELYVTEPPREKNYTANRLTISSMLLDLTFTTTTTTVATPLNLRVALTGGKDKSEGNVEVILKNDRFRVCDSNWGNKEAAVVCRMLGYSAGGIATRNSHFGADNKSIIFDNVECSGTESDLTQCSALIGEDIYCQNTDLAGVVCNKFSPSSTNAENIRCGLRPYDNEILTNLYKGRSNSKRKKYRNKTVVRNRLTQHRIIAGGFAQHGAYPWQVRVYQMFNAAGNIYRVHHCGGVLISEYWLLSAAHCFYMRHKKEFEIVVGDNNKKINDEEESHFAIQDIIIHEEYDDSLKDSDIALVKIVPKNGSGIHFSKYVQPVCLPTPETPYVPGTKCWVSGWGNVRPTLKNDGTDKGEYPEILKAVEIPLLSQKQCEYLYTELTPGYFSDHMLCAGYTSGGIDSCDGDSGGPLVCKIKDVYTLFGITSWGQGCALPNLPGVYTRVSQFLDWINSHIDKYSKNSAERQLPKSSFKN